MGVRGTGGVGSDTAETVGIVAVVAIVRFGFSGAFANTLRSEVYHARGTSQVEISGYLLGETFGSRRNRHQRVRRHHGQVRNNHRDGDRNIRNKVRVQLSVFHGDRKFDGRIRGHCIRAIGG